LEQSSDQRRWTCRDEHSFDVARDGYVNLLVAGQRRSREPGDSREMISARRRFLSTGAFDQLSDVLAELVRREAPTTVLDVGCGEGQHTRRLVAPTVLGIDVAKPAVALAARAHREGSYAVASASDVPLEPAAADVAVSVFGPLFPGELARVVRPGGTVVVAHPGPTHLESLRALVYAEPRPHEVKEPLRSGTEWFEQVESTSLTFPIDVLDVERLYDLFAMTPYRWHAPLDIRARLEAASADGFRTAADVQLTTYRRTA
jgi:23S rRNA (guanine745-N1)-methyltransferase